MTADEGASPADAAAAASKLLDQGAEIIIGPLFGPSVTAVAPLARDKGVPVLAFSTENGRWRAMASIFCPSCPRAKCAGW